jgi:hypothetical protein
MIRVANIRTTGGMMKLIYHAPRYLFQRGLRGPQHRLKLGNKKAPAAAYFPHPVARAVSWALRRFTSVFGMGTGGATSL